MSRLAWGRQELWMGLGKEDTVEGEGTNGAS